MTLVTPRSAGLVGALVLLISLLVLSPGAGAAESQSQVRSFELGPAVRASALTTGPDGNLWFAGAQPYSNGDDLVGRLGPGNAVQEFPFPPGDSDTPTVPSLAVGSDGNLWEAEGGANRIARVTPAGAITEFSLPAGSSRATGIAAGPDGNVWFTEEGASRVGRITPAGGITEFPLSAGAGPAGIVAGPDGNLWFTERGAGRIGRITTGGSVSEYPLPDPASQPTAIVAGPDGNLWFTEANVAKVGRITPAGEVAEFLVPADEAPLAIAAGPRGNVWFSAGVKIGALSTTGETVLTPVCVHPSCKVPVISLAVGPDGALWYGAGSSRTEGGGNSAILAHNASGFVAEFVPPAPRVSIGEAARSLGQRHVRLRLDCEGGEVGSPCQGTLRLAKRWPVSGPGKRRARRLILASRPYRLGSGEGRWLALRLRSSAVRLLAARGSLVVEAKVVTGGEVETTARIVLRRAGGQRSMLPR